MHDFEQQICVFLGIGFLKDRASAGQYNSRVGCLFQFKLCMRIDEMCLQELNHLEFH